MDEGQGRGAPAAHTGVRLSDRPQAPSRRQRVENCSQSQGKVRAQNAGESRSGVSSFSTSIALDSMRRSTYGGGFDLQNNVRMKKATHLEQRGRGFAARSLKARPKHRSRSQKPIDVSYVIVEARDLR